MTRWLLVALLLAPQTAASTQLATVAGVVVADDAASTAIADATVALSGGALETDLRVTTNAQGAFEFYGLPAGSYRVSAIKSGYVPAAYGAKRPGLATGVPVTVAAGERVAVTLALSPGALLTGHVLGSAGQPLPGASVSAFRDRDLNGDRIALPVASGVVDERGDYRIVGLPAGDFVVVATPRRELGSTFNPLVARTVSARPTGSPPMYYPGTTDPLQASPLTLTAGQQRSGIDFRLVVQPLMQIAGRVVLPDGQPAQGIQVTATPLSIPASVRSLVAPRTLRLEEDGGFSFSGCYAGRYAITARAAAPGQANVGPMSPATRSWWATAEVTIGTEDVSSLVLTVQPGTTVTGRVVFSGGTQPPAFASARVFLTRVASGVNTTAPVPPSRMNRDGSFIIEGVAPGRYRLSGSVDSAAGATSRWTLESAAWNGGDVRDSPLDINGSGAISDVTLTFSDTPTQLTGRLTDAAGRPAITHFVFVFPVERQFWVTGSSRIRPPGQPSAEGRFAIAGLPPGDYFLVALEDYDSADLEDSVFLEAASRAAIRVTLTRGQTTTQDVRLR